jgi:Flp pilus assembly protein TadG
MELVAGDVLMTRATHCNRRNGIAAPYVAMCLIVLVGVLALTVDGGVLMSERRHGQSAADVAALAAASALYIEDQVRTDPTQMGKDTDGSALTSSHTTSAGNGYVYNGSVTTAKVNMPPESGPFTGLAGYAEVIVQYNNPRSFSRIWGTTAVPTTARAVARGKMIPHSTAGIILLNPTAPKALRMTGNGDCSVNSGAVIVDSSDSQAAVVTGNGSVIAGEVDITGNNPGNVSTGNGFFNVPPGMLKTGQPVTADPFASLPAPDPNSMTIQSNSQLNISQGGGLLPGRYVGGISISGGTVTMAPGIYYMDHGGFSMSNGTLTGTGVMIYNDPASNNSQKIKLTGGSWNLSAPTGGTYTGMVIFQARGASSTSISITGGGTCNLIGAVYAKSSPVDVTGGGGATIGSMFVSDTLTVTGSGSFKVDWNGHPKPGVRDIRLVE